MRILTHYFLPFDEGIMNISDLKLPYHKQLNILGNPHLDSGLSVKDFILSQDLPSTVAEELDLEFLLNDANAKELWICVWFEDGDKEANECNLVIASSFEKLLFRLDYYRNETDELLNQGEMK